MNLSKRELIGLFCGLELALFLSALDQTVLNTAIPKISESLGAFDRAPWIITSYLLLSTLATPIAGKLADIFSAKRVLVAATAVFTVFSLACACSGNMTQLIIARALQGTGGGAMIALCFISIAEIFDVRERGRYQGVLAAAFILAAVIGPALGGFLAEIGQWRIIFLINIPLGILASICLQFFFPKINRARRPLIIDYAGAALLIIATIPLITGFSALAKSGNFNDLGGAQILASIVALVAFIFCERRAKEPLIPMTIFEDPLINISLLTVFVSGIGLFGGSLVMAVLLQQVLGQTPAQSGVVLSPLMLIVAGASIVSGHLIARTGRYKLLCIGALLCMCLGAFLLGTSTSKTAQNLVLCYAAISGIGLGMLLPIHAIVIQNVVSNSVLGVATSMSQFFRSLGGTIGTGIMSGLMIILLRSGSMQFALSSVFFIYGSLVAVTIVANFFCREVPLRTAETFVRPQSEPST